jgi:hypothetical protein
MLIAAWTIMAQGRCPAQTNSAPALAAGEALVTPIAGDASVVTGLCAVYRTAAEFITDAPTQRLDSLDFTLETSGLIVRQEHLSIPFRDVRSVVFGWGSDDDDAARSKFGPKVVTIGRRDGTSIGITRKLHTEVDSNGRTNKQVRLIGASPSCGHHRGHVRRADGSPAGPTEALVEIEIALDRFEGSARGAGGVPAAVSFPLSQVTRIDFSPRD